MTKINEILYSGLSRRALLQGSAGLIGGAALSGGLSMPAFAENAPIGTYPAGSSGSTITFGVAVPRTGTYAVQGEDELKGWGSRSSTSTPAMISSRNCRRRPARAFSARK